MNVLFYMDPFVDHNPSVERSINLTILLQIQSLAAIRSQELSIRLIVHESLLANKQFLHALEQKGVEILVFSGDQVRTLLVESGASLGDVRNGRSIPLSFCDGFAHWMEEMLGAWEPDFIITWESLPKYVSALFPLAIGLEGHHSAFVRIEKARDVLFNVVIGGQSNQEGIELPKISDTDRREFLEVRKFLIDHYSSNPVVEARIQELRSRYAKVLFFPGHLETYRFSKHCSFSNNTSFLHHLTNLLPDDCCIVYVPHPVAIDRKQGLGQLSHSKIFYFDDLIKHNPHLSLQLVYYCDATINISSNLATYAMALGKPVLDFGDTWLSRYSLSFDEHATGNLEEAITINPEKYEEQGLKVLRYICTRKVPIEYLAVPDNYLQYLLHIKSSVEAGEVSDPLPQVDTVFGWKFALESSLVTYPRWQLPRIAADQYEVIRGKILDPSIRAVGFDIFDTLVCRPSFTPAKLFSLLSPYCSENISPLFDFQSTRVLAERHARLHLTGKSKPEVTLDDIYASMKTLTDLPDQTLEELRTKEIELELRLLQPRKSAKRLFELAKANGKKIFIASDMYLDVNTIEKALSRNGYHGYDRVYVSSAEQKVKHTGLMFRKILHDLAISPEAVVFIGDNYQSDVEYPSRYGINAFHYPKPVEVLKKTKLCAESGYYIKIPDFYLWHLSIIANKVFDNPFIRFDFKSLVNRSHYLLGYSIFGPLALSITIWLWKQLGHHNIRKILFTSRDGYLIKQVYDRLVQSIGDQSAAQSMYFYTSRTACAPLNLQESLIPSACLLHPVSPNMNVESFLKSRFFQNMDSKELARLLKKSGLRADANARQSIPQITEFLHKYTKEHVDLDSPCLIKRYVDQSVEKNLYPATAFFDLGTKGTCQRAISSICNHRFKVFLFRRQPDALQMNENIYEYVFNQNNRYNSNIWHVSAPMYECILSHPYEGTTLGYEEIDGAIKPILEEKPIGPNLFTVPAVQKGIMAFCEECIDIFQADISLFNADGHPVFLLPLEELTSGKSDRDFMAGFGHDNPLYSNKEIKITQTGSGKTPDPTKSSWKSEDQQYNFAYEKNPFLRLIFGSPNALKRFKNNPYAYWQKSRYPIFRLLRFFCTSR